MHVESQTEMKNREGQCAAIINFRTFSKVRERCGTRRSKTFAPAMPKGAPPARECWCPSLAKDAIAYKKCSIGDINANMPCPGYTEWSVGPGGVGGPGSLVYPSNFCGPPLLPAPK